MNDKIDHLFEIIGEMTALHVDMTAKPPKIDNGPFDAAFYDIVKRFDNTSKPLFRSEHGE